VCRLIGLDTTLPDMEFKDMWEILQRDKKVVNEMVRFVVPLRLGEVKIIDDVDRDILQDTVQSCYSTNNFECPPN